MKIILTSLLLIIFFVQQVLALFCLKCGTELPDTARFCQKCGTRQQKAPEIDANKKAPIRILPIKKSYHHNKKTIYRAKTDLFLYPNRGDAKNMLKKNLFFKPRRYRLREGGKFRILENVDSSYLVESFSTSGEVKISGWVYESELIKRSDWTEDSYFSGKVGRTFKKVVEKSKRVTETPRPVKKEVYSSQRLYRTKTKLYLYERKGDANNLAKKNLFFKPRRYSLKRDKNFKIIKQEDASYFLESVYDNKRKNIRGWVRESELIKRSNWERE
ncbi:zinc ribbon domain-containing protein [Candidatus Riflebacteria bacterium]